MRTFLLLVIAAFIVLPSCKSKKMTTAVPVSEPVVQEVVTPPAAQPEPAAIADIPVRSERFTFDRVDDHTNHRYFVIVGSYSNPDNANRARTILVNQGFNPIILKSETGMNRVCVNSYANEYDARVRVAQIRSTFPEYHDAWLLIRQQ